MALKSPDRLRFCRRYRHGLSQAPPGGNASPRGPRAFLPCPREAEGQCPYRRVFRCHDESQAESRKLGHCLIEQSLYESLLESAASFVSAPNFKAMRPENQLRAKLWAEAFVYMKRVIAYVGLRQVGTVVTPSHSTLLRYMTAGMNAASRRLADLAPRIA